MGKNNYPRYFFTSNIIILNDYVSYINSPLYIIFKSLRTICRSNLLTISLVSTTSLTWQALSLWLIQSRVWTHSLSVEYHVIIFKYLLNTLCFPCQCELDYSLNLSSDYQQHILNESSMVIDLIEHTCLFGYKCCVCRFVI